MSLLVAKELNKFGDFDPIFQVTGGQKRLKSLACTLSPKVVDEF